MTNITVVGMGYVGLANAVLLSQHNQVRALEVIEEKVNLINDRVAPIQDDEVEKFFATKDLNLTATTDKKEAYGNDPEYVVIAAPTNYRSEEHTSELQSRGHLVCRLLPEKKTTNRYVTGDRITSRGSYTMR